MFNRKILSSCLKPGFVLLLVVLISGLAGGWGRRPHRTMTEASLDALPQWEKEIWKSQIPQIIEEYCLIPDFYLGRPDLAGYAILDVYDVEFSDYTYTLETIIQAGQKNMAVTSVPVRVNEDLRPSRLARNMPAYVWRGVITIVRIFVIYQPFRFFGFIGGGLLLLGFALGLRFLYYYLTGDGEAD